MPFQFSPPDGYRNTVTFPKKPANETAFRDQMMQPLDQLAAYLNGADPLPQYSGAALSKNLLINGSFQIWQRGTTFSNFVSAARYTADRWKCYRGDYVTGLFVARDDGSGVPGSAFPYCLRISRVLGDTNIQPCFATQPLTTLTSVQFRGKKLTLSVWLRKGSGLSSVGGTADIQILSGTGTDQDGTNFTGNSTVLWQTVTLTGSWQKFTFTTPAIGMSVRQLCLKIFFTPQGTSLSNDYIEIAQAQLNEGESALPFTARRFEDDLLDCLPYYQKSYTYSVAPGTSTLSGAEVFRASYATTFHTLPRVQFKVPLRAYPTIGIRNPNDGNPTNGVRNLSKNTDGGFNLEEITEKGYRLVTNGLNLSQGDDFGFHWEADAEL
jgi:hypothetical protein